MLTVEPRPARQQRAARLPKKMPLIINLTASKEGYSDPPGESATFIWAGLVAVMQVVRADLDRGGIEDREIGVEPGAMAPLLLPARPGGRILRQYGGDATARLSRSPARVVQTIGNISCKDAMPPQARARSPESTCLRSGGAGE